MHGDDIQESRRKRRVRRADGTRRDTAGSPDAGIGSAPSSTRWCTITYIPREWARVLMIYAHARLNLVFNSTAEFVILSACAADDDTASRISDRSRRFWRLS